MNELPAGILSFTIAHYSDDIDIKFTGIIAKSSIIIFKVELYNDSGDEIASGGVSSGNGTAAQENIIKVKEKIDKSKKYYYKMSTN